MTADKNKPTARKDDTAILVAVLLIFGLVLGGFGTYRYRTGRQSASWPTVTGKITYSRAESHRVDNGNQYLPSVRYTYAVDGRSYTSSGITASDVYEKSLGGANRILKKYPVGGEVPVSYNPENPNESVIETGVRKNVYVLMLAAVACFVFAVAIMMSALKKRMGEGESTLNQPAAE